MSNSRDCAGTTTAGSMPRLSLTPSPGQYPLGRKYLPEVTLTMIQPGRKSSDCETPLPNVFVPTRVAPTVSLSAPANNSAADALFSLISTTTGLPTNMETVEGEKS